MKVLMIVQARLGSSRLPGKVLKEVVGQPLLKIMLSRLSKSKCADQIVVATGVEHENASLIEAVKSWGYSIYAGSQHDVLKRFYDCAEQYNPDYVVRLTGDCPLIDVTLVDEVIESILNSDFEYVCNNYPATYPDGLDAEVFTFDALKNAYLNAVDSYDREHVTPYLRKPGFFKTHTLSADKNHSDKRWTLDQIEDLEVIKFVFEALAPDVHFGWKEVLELQCEQPVKFEANCEIQRNEGSTMSSGTKLWRRAKQLIPGGNMLLSKRPEMFLPDGWPTYFSEASGVVVKDLDGNSFTDMALMGVGTNTLGYGHPKVDEAVQRAVRQGNMSSLNCPEEVMLAERMVALHPWADMVRFSRAGGEANSIAIRIARAATGRDKIAVCGYHGWHDWYLSVNLSSDDSLDQHLLPGLDPKGVPKDLEGSVITFMTNDIERLRDIIEGNEIAAVKMEVKRNIEPEDGYLQAVRELCDKHGVVLIFDECTSGFRETFGGLHLKYGVNPDMAVFGKALGNGYPITAVIGTRDVMDAAQSTFISSTFWTERIGPSAALATLEVMEQEQSWLQITDYGCKVRDAWKHLAERYKLDIECFGLPALGGFSLKGEQAVVLKTLISQELLKQGILASNALYPSIAHTEDHLLSYLKHLEAVFSTFSSCIKQGDDPMGLLDGALCHSTFKRLN
ncbi:aminotransferase class III-fold pyridoxal phosphate-dependent enzyme [Neptuniibacter sp. SY11_33]|uniref:aminotransferase class III-fold pyridoxal phosphate-dependent enzyme n=1 Tax=Neptuniibacter sp. SY11_33 TaxID=3398215 RepID=UPI0039F57411